MVVFQQHVVDDFAGLHARVNLGGKWKGKKLTDEQKRYVLNLRKEGHEGNVEKRARDKEAAQERRRRARRAADARRKSEGSL